MSDTAPDTGTDLQAEVDKWKALARKHEDKAKANSSAAKELEQLRAAQMTETELAVAAARAEGLAEGTKAIAVKLVAAEMKAAAAGRLEADQLNTLLEGVNQMAFLDDAGDVDVDKVSKFIDGVAPAPKTDDQPAGFPDLGQGASRGGRDQTPLGSDPLLGLLKGALDIK
jgi:hypothetical protein